MAETPTVSLPKDEEFPNNSSAAPDGSRLSFKLRPIYFLVNKHTADVRKSLPFHDHFCEREAAE